MSDKARRSYRRIHGDCGRPRKTYVWAVRFAEKARRATAIVGTPRITPHVDCYVSMLVDSITCDATWDGGWYREAHEVWEGLHRHSRLWALMGLSPGFLKVEGWRVPGFSSLDDFLRNFLDASFQSMGPNNLLGMARKWRRTDTNRRTSGDLADALGRIEARVVVLPIGSDKIFTVADCFAEQELIRRSELKVLETRSGHAGRFGMDLQYRHQVDDALGHLLAQPA